MTCVTRHNYSVTSECVMLDRYGYVYECIDNVYHPNPGTEETKYDEIERTIDWLYANGFGTSHKIKDLLITWIRYQVADNLKYFENDFDNLVKDVLYCDTYTPDPATVAEIRRALDYVETADGLHAALSVDIVSVCRDIATWLNERFLRVRAGGKLNPQGTDSIYFRISSHGYDWRNNIEHFLRDTFGNIDKMPGYIWIGHDAETNPPEIVLFEGTPSELLEVTDSKILAAQFI